MIVKYLRKITMVFRVTKKKFFLKSINLSGAK